MELISKAVYNQALWELKKQQTKTNMHTEYPARADDLEIP